MQIKSINCIERRWKNKNKFIFFKFQYITSWYWISSVDYRRNDQSIEYINFWILYWRCVSVWSIDVMYRSYDTRFRNMWRACNKMLVYVNDQKRLNNINFPLQKFVFCFQEEVNYLLTINRWDENNSLRKTRNKCKMQQEAKLNTHITESRNSFYNYAPLIFVLNIPMLTQWQICNNAIWFSTLL